MKFKFEKGYEIGTENWDKTNIGLMADLDELVANKVSEEEIAVYLSQMYDSLETIENGRCDNMLFLMYAEPGTMPGDARVRYVYKPTYIAATIMMTVYCRFESLRKNEKLNAVLKDVLNATMGRNFSGAGYDSTYGFLHTLEIFAKGDTVKFVEKYPQVNKDFVTQFNKAVTFLETEICAGKVIDPWSGKDAYSDKGKIILASLEKGRI